MCGLVYRIVYGQQAKKAGKRDIFFGRIYDLVIILPTVFRA